ncbi:MAG: CoA transferase, partial [Actinomycetota bacterium]|nr:CoA transferase [Actinomycetota bacterium]
MATERRATPDGGPARVVDLSDRPSGGYAGRLLGTHGWEVIKVEPPGGGGYRLLGPFPDDQPDPDSGAVAAFLDCSKKSVVLDFELASDRATLDKLLTGADAVITTGSRPVEHPLAATCIVERHEHLVVTSITPFGLDGPYADLASSPIVLEAMSGWLYQTGEPGGEPVRIRGELPSALIPGLSAAIGTLAAQRWHRGGGRGQVVEISEFEAMVAANRYFETHYAQFGEHIGRCGAMLFPYYGYARAADGWTAPCAVTERHVRLVAQMMGRDAIPDAAELDAWFSAGHRAELFHEGQAHGIPWGY